MMDFSNLRLKLKMDKQGILMQMVYKTTEILDSLAVTVQGKERFIMLTKQFLLIASIVVSLLMIVVVNLLRLRNTKQPAVAKKIILPPLFMATGASMFILPMFRPTVSELISSVVMGMLCSIILIKTSKFEIRDNQIYHQRSKLFLVALIGLVALRMIGKIFLAETIHIDPAQMSGIFFILAFSMILPWRISMYIGFRKLKRQLDNA